MPEIADLPALPRPVLETDYLLIQAGEACYRAPGTAFVGPIGPRGLKGDTGDQGERGEQGEPGEQGIPGTMAGVRQTATLTTASLATNASENGTVTLAKTFELLGLTLSQGARVRLYSTADARTADQSRDTATPPTPGAGVILDVALEDAASQTLNPHAHGASMETVPSAAIAYRVQNLGTEGPVSITFQYIPKEA